MCLVSSSKWGFPPFLPIGQAPAHTTSVSRSKKVQKKVGQADGDVEDLPHARTEMLERYIISSTKVRYVCNMPIYVLRTHLQTPLAIISALTCHKVFIALCVPHFWLQNVCCSNLQLAYFKGLDHREGPNFLTQTKHRHTRTNRAIRVSTAQWRHRLYRSSTTQNNPSLNCPNARLSLG